MNDQQLRSMLAKRSVQDKRAKEEAQAAKKETERRKANIKAMHLLGKGLLDGK